MDPLTVALDSPQFNAIISLAEFEPTFAAEHKQIGTEIASLFEHAMTQRLKYPKIRLLTATSETVVLRRAGQKSKHTGSIQILSEGRYLSNTYFGRIDPLGNLLPSRSMTAEVLELLGRLALNPAEVALEYGKLTGHCCFCDRALSDARSLSHGYGPHCARVFGLPWLAPRNTHGFFGNVWNEMYGVPAETA